MVFFFLKHQEIHGIQQHLLKPYLLILKIQIIVIGSVATLRILKSTLGTGHTHTKKE